MYTSATCLALVCSIAFPTLNAPIVHRSYGDAKEASTRLGRPIAMFVTKADSPALALKDGDLSPQAQKVLADEYVCLVIDPSTAENRKLADALGITGENGLVISDRSGAVQAYFHDGKIGGNDLVSRLSFYADSNVVVATTQTNAPPPVAAPVFAPAPVYAPRMAASC